MSLSPRNIAAVHPSPLTNSALVLFVLTFIFSVGVLRWIEDRVPEISLRVALLLRIVSIGALVEAPAPSGVAALGTPDRVIELSRDLGIVVALNGAGLLAAAQSADCTIEQLPQVDGFVAKGNPLFAFRIAVDLAAKALSRPINDPTTAVLAIDPRHWRLRAVGRRSLDSGAVA